MKELVEFLKQSWSRDWTEKAKKLFENYLQEGGRYYQDARKNVQIRCPRQNPDEGGVPYLALIHVNNADSGRYGGMSFVVFPVKSGACLFGMVVGKQGLAPDEAILGRPGHARKIGAISRWLNSEFSNTTRIAWAKHDPSRTDVKMISEKEYLSMDPDAEKDEYSPILNKYGDVIYGICHAGRASDEAIEKALKAYLDLMFQERGVSIKATAKKEADHIEQSYLSYLFPSVTKKEMAEILSQRKYVILEGPPGTGKTEMALQLLREEYQGIGKSIQFHPNITYEEFIGGLKPEKAENGFGFMFMPKPGILMESAKEAEDGKYLFHIDEINRADLAKVLGEAIYLFESKPLETRKINLPYDFGETFGNVLQIPENLHVLGTMNSADRSIAILDIAIRRRFAFIRLWPQMAIVQQHGCELCQDAFSRLLNVFIEYASEDAFNLIPGHGYFTENDPFKAKLRLKTEVLPLLEEYLFQGYVAGFSDKIRDYLDWLTTACKQTDK